MKYFVIKPGMREMGDRSNDLVALRKVIGLALDGRCSMVRLSEGELQAIHDRLPSVNVPAMFDSDRQMILKGLYEGKIPQRFGLSPRAPEGFKRAVALLLDEGWLREITTTTGRTGYEFIPRSES